MNKIKLHNKIFGYRICRIDDERKARFLSKIIRSGFTLTAVTEGKFIIKEADYKAMKPILNEFGASLSDTQGLFGLLKRQSKRYGVIFAAIITLLLSFISADTVWDIRISGNQNISADIIKSELSGCGLDIGASWRKTDKNKVEAELLSSSEYISWININRRGSVAYVDIIEKESVDKAEDIKYSNIIAKEDGIIEQISVKSGYAMVKVGDTVKKGDILIAGIKGENGDFCRAEGTVIGRSWSDISAFIDKNGEEKIYEDEKKCALIIKIFNFPINIFKNYGNSDTKYDIIRNIKPVTFGKKCTLPINIITEYKREYRVVDRMLNDEELTEAAREEMSRLIAEKSENAQILKIRTDGEFMEKGYKMTSHISYIHPLGCELPFTVN